MPKPKLEKLQREAEEAQEKSEELKEELHTAKMRLQVTQSIISDYEEGLKEDEKSLDELSVSLKLYKSTSSKDILKTDEVDDEGESPKITPKDVETIKSQHEERLKEKQDELETIQQKIDKYKEKISEYSASCKKHQKEIDRLTPGSAKADKDALEKTKVAIKATEEAILTADKKIYRWLSWDGNYTNKGKCNQHIPDEEAKNQWADRRKKFAQDHKANKTFHASILPMDAKSKVSLTIRSKESVSARIISCEKEFYPVSKKCCFKIQMKRVYLIQSLLMRVSDKDGTPVYQEVLNAEKIDQLQSTDKAKAISTLKAQRAAWQQPEELLVDKDKKKAAYIKRLEKTREYATPAKSPYRLRVWVSVNADEFDGVALDEDIETEYGKCVDDQSFSSTKGLKSGSTKLNKIKIQKQKFGDKGNINGVEHNRVNALRVKMINTAMLLTATHQKTGTANARKDLDAQVQAVQDVVESVNTLLGDARPLESRILVASEWNFKKKNSIGKLYTLAEKEQIIDTLHNLCENDVSYAPWILMPGSILWGKPQATGYVASFNTLPIIWQGDGNKKQYNKKRYGSDTKKKPTDMLRAEHTCLFITRKSELNRKKVPKSLKKFMIKEGWLTENEDISIKQVVTPDEKWIAETEKQGFVITKPSVGGEGVLIVRPRELYVMPLGQAGFTDYCDTNFQWTDYNKPNFVEANNLKIAFEICADHAYGCVIGTYTAANGNQSVTNNTHKGVDIHLVPTCGVSLQLWKSPCRTGGLFFWCDGVGRKSKIIFTIKRLKGIISDNIKNVITTAQALEERAVEPGRNGTVEETRFSYYEDYDAKGTPYRLFRQLLEAPQ